MCPMYPIFALCRGRVMEYCLECFEKNIPLERSQNLINSMPNSCKAVMKNQGHAIKY